MYKIVFFLGKSSIGIPLRLLELTCSVIFLLDSLTILAKIEEINVLPLAGGIQ